MGDRINAHFLPDFVTSLLRNMKWYPLWSCVCRDRFGFGRIPASTASVEASFNDIKTRVFSNIKLPTRVDTFVFKHIEYINGRTKIGNANEIVPKTNVQGYNNLTLTNATNQIQCQTHFVPPIDCIRQEVQQLDNLVLCSSCANSEIPTGAHTCQICNKSVHALDSCSSLFGDEEGYGQKRICNSCKRLSTTTLTTVLESRVQENWRGLSQKDPIKKARYLQTNYTANEFVIH